MTVVIAFINRETIHKLYTWYVVYTCHHVRHSYIGFAYSTAKTCLLIWTDKSWLDSSRLIQSSAHLIRACGLWVPRWASGKAPYPLCFFPLPEDKISSIWSATKMGRIRIGSLLIFTFCHPSFRFPYHRGHRSAEKFCRRRCCLDSWWLRPVRLKLGKVRQLSW